MFYGVVTTMFSVGLAMSLATWLQTVIGQPYACECVDWSPYPVMKRLPSSTMTSLTVFAGFVTELVHPLLGLFLPVLLGFSEVFQGSFSSFVPG